MYSLNVGGNHKFRKIPKDLFFLPDLCLYSVYYFIIPNHSPHSLRACMHVFVCVRERGQEGSTQGPVIVNEWI